jgi:hypothetical protein
LQRDRVKDTIHSNRSSRITIPVINTVNKNKAAAATIHKGVIRKAREAREAGVAPATTTITRGRTRDMISKAREARAGAIP